MNYFLICVLFLTLCNQSLSFTCRWMDHKFKQYNSKSLSLLTTMGGDLTEDSVSVGFPDGLYTQASHLPGDAKAWFIVQALEEITELFDEDLDSVSWVEKKVEDFLAVLDNQAEGLRSCITTKKKKNKKLHMYFKRLNNILNEMEHNAKAWELIRKEVRKHLQRLDII